MDGDLLVLDGVVGYRWHVANHVGIATQYFAVFKIAPHPVFDRACSDLVATLAAPLLHIMERRDILIPHPSGKQLRVKLPYSAGSLLRVKGGTYRRVTDKVRARKTDVSCVLLFTCLVQLAQVRLMPPWTRRCAVIEPKRFANRVVSVPSMLSINQIAVLIHCIVQRACQCWPLCGTNGTLAL